MNRDKWKKRIAERTDVSGHLVHLTKANDEISAEKVLMKILEERVINGSTTDSGFICGKKAAVCFQDAPLYSIAQNIYYEQKLRKEKEESKVRYTGFGLLFTKIYVFKKDGRPAIYDKTISAKKYLPENEWWRIVNLDLSDEDRFIDWTHEREWRVPNSFEFELSKVHVLVPNEKAYKGRLREFTQR